MSAESNNFGGLPTVIDVLGVNFEEMQISSSDKAAVATVTTTLPYDRETD